jgi:hypothetical protein
VTKRENNLALAIAVDVLAFDCWRFDRQKMMPLRAERFASALRNIRSFSNDLPIGGR